MVIGLATVLRLYIHGMGVTPLRKFRASPRRVITSDRSTLVESRITNYAPRIVSINERDSLRDRREPGSPFLLASKRIPIKRESYRLLNVESRYPSAVH